MIKFTDGTTVRTTTILGGQRHTRGAMRESLEIHIPEGYTFEQIKALFADGVSFSVAEDAPQYNEDGSPKLNENGEQIFAEQEFDKSDYSIGGDITDKRDGTFVVLMAQKTEVEKVAEENAELLLAMIGGEV